MIEVSYIAAFLGGFLMLLPSCGPFVLPAFFAYGFKERKRLLASTMVFFLGFLSTFLPLGLGITALAGFFVVNKKILNIAAGILLIIFALLALFGKSIPFIPYRLRAPASVPEKKDFLSLFLFGAAFGLAATGCTAPILGAVLTVAAAAGIGFQSIALLFTFAFGMMFPLMILAFYFDEVKVGRIRKWFFGKTFVFPLTNMLSAFLFGALGYLFLTAQASSPFLTLGTSLGLFDFFFTANEKILLWSDRLPVGVDILFLAMLLSLLGWFFFRKRK